MPGASLSAFDLRDADFSNAAFDASSSVHGTWFAGANLFDVAFNGTKFLYDASLPHCGAPPSTCNSLPVPNGCQRCPCAADLACHDLGSGTGGPQARHGAPA